MIYAKIQPPSSVLEKKIFKGFYHIRIWRPSWSTDRDHFSNLSFPEPKEAPRNWTKLAQGLQRMSFENVDGRTDDGWKVITIAHPEHSSGELIKHYSNKFTDFEIFTEHMYIKVFRFFWAMHFSNLKSAKEKQNSICIQWRYKQVHKLTGKGYAFKRNKSWHETFTSLLFGDFL